MSMQYYPASFIPRCPVSMQLQSRKLIQNNSIKFKFQ